MAAPTLDDVETFTSGRLTDTRTELLLTAVIAAARKYCGWHVTGERTDTITVDGTGGQVLLLPTLQLVDVLAVTEDDEDVDLDTIHWSTRGALTKHRPHQGWTRRYRGVTATITHGFADAPDWNTAILSAVDRLSMGGAAKLVAGPYQYFAEPPVTGSMFSIAEKAILDAYRLEPGACGAQIVSGS